VRVVIVAPTYQEAENIDGFLRAVRASVPAAHILVVDDNSPDGTAGLARAVASELGDITVHVRPGKAGLGAAYRDAFGRVLDQNFEVVVSMDVDFSHDPAAIPSLLTRIDAGADAVVGSRYVAGGGTVNWPAHRRLLSRWGNRYTSLILRVPVRDCTSGFRAYRADALRAIEPGTTTADGYAMLTEFARRFVRHGYRVDEVPITFVDRQHGASKMSGRIVVESMLLVTWWGVRDLFRRPSAARRG
jgi:dolichol-phosphate mannosyltransferase